MSERRRNLDGNSWLEQSGGEWFVCYSKRTHGKKEIVRISVKLINEKTKETEVRGVL